MLNFEEFYKKETGLPWPGNKGEYFHEIYLRIFDLLPSWLEYCLKEKCSVAINS